MLILNGQANTAGCICSSRERGFDELLLSCAAATPQDPMVTSPMKIPCRMAVEVLSAVFRVHEEAKHIPSHLRIIIIHARQDSIVEPAVSLSGDPSGIRLSSRMWVFARQLKAVGVNNSLHCMQLECFVPFREAPASTKSRRSTSSTAS